jgi:hypothetical protein
MQMSMTAKASYNCSCDKKPCLIDCEIALLEDVNVLINMRIDPDKLVFNVCTEIVIEKELLLMKGALRPPNVEKE